MKTNSIIDKVQKWGITEQDSPEIIFEKKSLLIISILTAVCGLIWGFMYYLIYGWSRHTFLPWIFCAIVGIAIFVFIIRKNYQFLVWAYLLCILLITNIIQFSLGGLVASGSVTFWAVMAPFGALMFQRKQANFWLFSFTSLQLLLIIFDDNISQWEVKNSSTIKNMFFAMNLLGPSFTMYFGMRYFVDAFYREHKIVQAFNEEIQQQKEAISQINEELNSTLHVVESERAKSDKLLLNILPTEVASELKETGRTEVKYFESVTVLFADVKGFSALATKISPQALIAQLDETFTKMDEISQNYGLERIKTIGDCYMACAGLPNANKTHPFEVVLASLGIQDWMNKEREKRNGDFWQVRLGMHTGDAVAGVIGKTKFAYDIWGSTVNLASRMESAGEVGRVNVTQATFEIVKDYFVGDYREEIEAKNIGKVRAYFIERLKPEFSKDENGILPNEKFCEMLKNL